MEKKRYQKFLLLFILLVSSLLALSLAAHAQESTRFGTDGENVFYRAFKPFERFDVLDFYDKHHSIIDFITLFMIFFIPAKELAKRFGGYEENKAIAIGMTIMLAGSGLYFISNLLKDEEGGGKLFSIFGGFSTALVILAIALVAYKYFASNENAFTWEISAIIFFVIFQAMMVVIPSEIMDTIFRGEFLKLVLATVEGIVTLLFIFGVLGFIFTGTQKVWGRGRGMVDKIRGPRGNNPRPRNTQPIGTGSTGTDPLARARREHRDAEESIRNESKLLRSVRQLTSFEHKLNEEIIADLKQLRNDVVKLGNQDPAALPAAAQHMKKITTESARIHEIIEQEGRAHEELQRRQEIDYSKVHNETELMQEVWAYVKSQTGYTDADHARFWEVLTYVREELERILQEMQQSRKVLQDGIKPHLDTIRTLEATFVADLQRAADFVNHSDIRSAVAVIDECVNIKEQQEGHLANVNKLYQEAEDYIGDEYKNEQIVESLYTKIASYASGPTYSSGSGGGAP